MFDKYGQKSNLPWTKICLLKAVLIEGKGYAQLGEQLQANELYRTAAAWIELNIDTVKSIPQLSYWAEQILGEYVVPGPEAVFDQSRLKIFEIWSSLTRRSQELSPSTYGNNKAAVPRSTIWEMYYDLASHGLDKAPHGSSQARQKQAAEIQAIESAYETNLLKNKKFPKATETNAVVEQWVERVIKNWQILCGPGWQESDLGSGGRNAITRNVLDILYRAAMKTFHSTLILRRLFQVHKSLTEFDLAYKCLDTYIELVDRSRQRASKAGAQSPESEEVMLSVVSEGVEGLCSYGGLDEARKAHELAAKLEDWLDEIMPEEDYDMSNGHTDPVQPVNGSMAAPPSVVTLETVYRAIGIARAHWAKWTPFSETRSDSQREALVALQKACRVSQPRLQTLYALALLCAETRDISQALRWTKLGLQKISQPGSGTSVRDQCAFWHLMTLLLSSQQEFDTAIQSSAATLDSIISLELTDTQNGSTEKHVPVAVAHIADDLECDDLQKVTELQMTYLALIELVDGSEAALNRSSELLSLYSKLFKRFEVGELKPSIEQSLVPPKSSSGTIKGSIFSRRKPASSIAASATTTSLRSAAKTEQSARPATQASEAPTIQVTDETGHSPSSKKHHHLVHRHRHHEATPAKGSTNHSQAKGTKPDKHMPAPVQHSTNSASSADPNNLEAISSTMNDHDFEPEAKQPLRDMPHNIASHEKAPPPLGHTGQPPEQDVRLPNMDPSTTSTSPISRFSKTAAQKHALVILSKIWLTISTLYRRSHMFEDAKEACDEATKAASRIEALASVPDPSARALAAAGWGGGGKSSDQVWADVCSSKAELLYSIAQRRDEEGTPTTGENLREVVEQYEQCLMYYPNHSAGIIGLSNILLDYYDRKIDLAKKVDDGKAFGIRSTPLDVKEDDILGPKTPSHEHLHDPFSSSAMSGEELRKTPENLNRLAARDRAYGLLNMLTKLGSGWDNAEAWFALARAHELGGEVDRAKKILWWCIELEDTRPIRHWQNLGCGGYVL